MAMAAAAACTAVTPLAATGAAAATAPSARWSAGSLRMSLPCAFVSSEVHASSSSIAFNDGRILLRTAARPVERRRQGRFEVCGLFGLGVPELAVIAGVAALVFGPKQLPAIGKSLGKTVKSFQTAAKEFESEISKAKESGEEGQDSTAVGETPKEGVVTSPKNSETDSNSS
ncbi:uncharacterized protein [Physcomitrium patens]|nr:uncharacterized protein LOC112292936 [Physcomitrium patens]PNR39272.1 hypothetical protein PHYPA_019550 [Physcomitrium patens]|eukprot:XP_024397721.1 uncharacterized protein LOC112292936 [Physcomitrella patens]